MQTPPQTQVVHGPGFEATLSWTFTSADSAQVIIHLRSKQGKAFDVVQRVELIPRHPERVQLEGAWISLSLVEQNQRLALYVIPFETIKRRIASSFGQLKEVAVLDDTAYRLRISLLHLLQNPSASFFRFIISNGMSIPQQSGAICCELLAHVTQTLTPLNLKRAR